MQRNVQSQGWTARAVGAGRRRRRIAAAVLVLGVLALGGCGEPADTHPGQPVTHRREAFRALLRVFEPMGVSLREQRYDAAKFQAQAEQLPALAQAPWMHFGEGTMYPPSKALPAIWAQPADFAKRRDAFVAATTALAAAAAQGAEPVARAAYVQVETQCRECHEIYKQR